MATAFVLATLTVALILSLAANALFLQLGSRWAKIPNVTFLRAFWATVAASLVNWLPLALLGFVRAPGWAMAIAISGLQIVLSIGLTWLITKWVFKTSLWRAAAAWLATLIPNAALLAVTFLIVRPYMFETFKTPTNSMAPTILGYHWEAPCPRCGSPAYCTPEDERMRPSDSPVLMVCSKERRACRVANPPHEQHSCDRFIVCKFLRPERWDIIVFRMPEDPKVIFCKRLVGLPGETVTIRDGAVWVDGKKQTPPESCRGIEYLDHVGQWPEEVWGGEAKPAKLGPDEYFVLGDFSAYARDSRFWERGAPGHPPYAVPGSYIIGVATHLYWPMDRCQALR
jgi:signal peptidase I